MDNTCGKRFNWDLGNLPHGFDHKYIYSHIGYNLKLTDMQAAIGLAQLNKLDEFIKQRKKNYSFLYNNLEKLDEIFSLPKPARNSIPSWFGFPIRVRKSSPKNRDEIIYLLNKVNIGTRLLFAGNMTKQPFFKQFQSRIPKKLLNSDVVMNDVFWIGVQPNLTEKMKKFIVNQLLKLSNKA